MAKWNYVFLSHLTLSSSWLNGIIICETRKREIAKQQYPQREKAQACWLQTSHWYGENEKFQSAIRMSFARRENEGIHENAAEWRKNQVITRTARGFREMFFRCFVLMRSNSLDWERWTFFSSFPPSADRHHQISRRCHADFWWVVDVWWRVFCVCRITTRKIDYEIKNFANFARCYNKLYPSWVSPRKKSRKFRWRQLDCRSSRVPINLESSFYKRNFKLRRRQTCENKRDENSELWIPSWL